MKRIAAYFSYFLLIPQRIHRIGGGGFNCLVAHRQEGEKQSGQGG